MAFFEYELPGPGEWHRKVEARVEPPYFQINPRPRALFEHSCRMLEQITSHETNQITLAYSGGNDSLFLLLCLEHLVRQGIIDPQRVRVCMGDYREEGASLTPGLRDHVQWVRYRGFALDVVDLEITDPGCTHLLINKFHETASHNLQQIPQYVMLDQFPGDVVLVAEGGPTVMPPPRILDRPRPRGQWVMLSALEYERGRNLCFYSTDRDLWATWLIQENVEFRQPPLTRPQFETLTPDQQRLWSTLLRYHWRHRLYTAGFPDHAGRFHWKRQSWILPLNTRPCLAEWKRHTLSRLGGIKPPDFHPDSWTWQELDCYHSHAWARVQITGPELD